MIFYQLLPGILPWFTFHSVHTKLAFRDSGVMGSQQHNMDFGMSLQSAIPWIALTMKGLAAPTSAQNEMYGAEIGHSPNTTLTNSAWPLRVKPLFLLKQLKK